MLALLISYVLLVNPCTFTDLEHYDLARQYHEHAGDMHVAAETEVENCTCACGPCAVHAVELAKKSEEWAIYEQQELDSITKTCRDYLNGKAR